MRETRALLIDERLFESRAQAPAAYRTYLAAYGSRGFIDPEQRPAELKALVEQAIARIQAP